MKKALHLVLIALLLIFAVSCRNVVYIPIHTGGGSETTMDSTTAFQNTFGTVAWDNVIESAVGQAGDGLVNGMRSTLVEIGEPTGSSSMVRTMSASPLADGPEVRATPVEMLLTIFFDGFTDRVSGVSISSGTMEFTLSAEKTETTDTETSTTTTRYQVESYTATTTQNLAMSGNGAEANVNVAEISNITASMTVFVSSTVTAGEEITSATAVNVSMNVSTSTGSITVNNDDYDIEEVIPDTPVVPEPVLGAESRPYQVYEADDVAVLQSVIAKPSEKFYVELMNDLTLPKGFPSIVIPSGYNIDLDLGGYRLSRISETAPTEATGTPKTYGDDSSTYLITVDGGTLSIHDGILGGTLFTSPVARIIYVDKGGVIDMENLEVYQFTNTRGSTININDGSAQIDGIKVYATYYALFINTGAEAEVENSTFCSIASNQLVSKDSSGYAYAVSANGTLNMDNSTVRGIQGAISINGGSATLGADIKSYVTKDIFQNVHADYHTYYMNWLSTPAESHELVDNELWSALYVSGEYTESSVIVNGGEYTSEGNAGTVRVGNSGDGGVGEAAGAIINDGVFANIGPGRVVIDENAVGPGEYGYGILTINGGKFKDSKDDTVAWLNGFVNPETHRVSDTPASDGYYSVSAL